MVELLSNGPKRIKQTVVAKRTVIAIRDGYPTIVNEGGTSSGKTYGEVFIAVLLASDKEFRRKILSENWPKLANIPLRISLVSHSLPHIKRGMLRDFKMIMNDLNLWNDNNWSATDFVFTFEDGSYIELFGLEDPSRAKGPRRDILILNEGNLVAKELFYQLAMRTTGPKIVDLNPSDFNSWCYVLADNPRNKKLHSTYLDNIENLHESQVQYVEDFKNLPDDFLWKVYGLGQRGASKETIYTAWKKCEVIPEQGEVFYGLDFGFTNPCAMVKVTHYEGANYVEELLYETGITDLVPYLQRLVPKRATIYADSAEPKSIELIYRAGFNIKPSDKDVWAGIMNVKSMPLYVSSSSKHLQAELMSYKWKKDKNDNVLEEPVKENDHLCDAMRYAIFTRFGQPRKFVGVIKTRAEMDAAR